MSELTLDDQNDQLLGSEETKSGTLIIVEKYGLKKRELIVFEEWFKVVNCAEASRNLKKLGINLTRQSIADWTHKEWWKAMFSLVMDQAQAELKANILNHDKDLVTAYGQLLSGTFKSEKTANAVSSLIKERFAAMDDPITKKKPNVAIQNNLQQNNLLVTREAMSVWTQEQVNEFARTGVAPQPTHAEGQ